MYESWRNYCEKLGLDPGLLFSEEDDSVFNNVAESITDFINQNGISGEAVFAWEKFDNNDFSGKGRLGILVHTPAGQLIRYIPRPLDERIEDGADFTTELERVLEELGKKDYTRFVPVGRILVKVGHNVLVEEAVPARTMDAGSLIDLQDSTVALASPEYLVLKLAGGEVTVTPGDGILVYTKHEKK